LRRSVLTSTERRERSRQDRVPGASRRNTTATPHESGRTLLAHSMRYARFTTPVA